MKKQTDRSKTWDISTGCLTQLSTSQLQNKFLKGKEISPG